MKTRPRFYTAHLITAVVVAALVFAVIRRPETLRCSIVALVGGLFVVLPVLGTVEFLTPPNSPRPQLGWRAVAVVCTVAVGGMFAATVVGFLLITWFEL